MGAALDIKEFEHVLRASAGITGETVFVVLGSQAVLAQFPDIPPAMRKSAELDIYPKFRPELAEVIDGAIGADSPFHGTFGYHADGIGPETARLPGRWEDRAVTFKTADGAAAAICPEIHDLAVSKLLAGRPKDMDWLQSAIEGGFVEPHRVLELLLETDAEEDELVLARARLSRMTP